MNHYFITGATGNIGAALVAVLLRRDDADAIQLLIRARSDEHLRERFDGLCAFWEILPEKALEKIILSRGDMTEPHFALDVETYNTLSKECTHIVHCGGVVRMNLPLEEARIAAVGVAKEIVELGLKAKLNGCLKKIDFVSTVGVVGKLKQPLTERLITEPRDFHNTYEQAKAEAEEFLHDYMVDNKLPITIHRPSMVVGDSITGKVRSYQIFYHICEFVSGKRTMGILPDLKEVRLDIVSVNYVAKVIEWATQSPKSIGRFIHECSGMNGSLGIDELERQLLSYQYFSRYKMFFKRKTYLPLVAFEVILKIASPFFPAPQRKILLTLPYFLNYMKDPQIFNDYQTQELLLQSIKKPLLRSYVPRILEAYINHRNETK